MINTLTNRTRATDTDAVLHVVAAVIDRSGIVNTLQQAAPAKSAAGAPPRYGQYTARGVLITMFHAVFAGRPASVAELCALIWSDYTDQQLAFIGMSDLRTPQRRAVLASNDKAWRNEHQRLWQYLQVLLRPMDDTPERPANTRVDKEASKAAQRRAAATLTERTELRRRVLNDLVTASIDTSLLQDWKGDLAIDEHVVHVSKSFTKYFDDKGLKASATPLANFYPKQNRVGAGWSVGLTRAVTTSRPYGSRVPTLCVALDINGSSAGTAAAAITCLDQFLVSGLHAKKAGNDRTYLVTDQAYSRTIGFNVDALERGFSLLMHYEKDAKIKEDLGRVLDPEAQSPGPFLYRGSVLCPASQHLINQKPLPSKTVQGQKADLEAFNEQQAALQQFAMPMNGRPRVTADRRPGRPSKGDATEPKRVIKLRVKCPAAAGKVRCAIRAAMDEDGSYLDPKNSHLPDVSGSAPFDQWPVICDKANTTITLTPKKFRRYQPVMEGSWEHEDWMSCNRSRDEGFNSILTSTEGGNLQDRSLYARRNPMLSLTIGFSVARANIKVQESWRATLRSSGGNTPSEPRAHLRDLPNRGRTVA